MGITATADHVVVALNTAGRTLLGDVVGRPVCATLPHPDLLAALDAAFHEARPGSVPLPAPPVTVGCAPIRDGVLLHMTAADASGAERARSTALQRLTSALSGAATPSAIARLVVTSAARAAGRRPGGASTPGPGAMLTALHRTGWGTEVITLPSTAFPCSAGRPLSDAVLTGVPVWLENAEQWRRPVPRDGGRGHGQRVPGDRVPADAGRGPRPGRTGVQLPDAARLLGGRARVPHGRRGPVRTGTGPRPAARRRAGRPCGVPSGSSTG